MSTIDCQGARALLMPYLDSELDAATTQRVNEHLLRCPPCRRRYAAEQLLDAGVAGLAGDELPMPVDVSARLDQALLAASESAGRDAAGPVPDRGGSARPAAARRASRGRRRQPPRARRLPWAPLVSLAAAALVVVAALLSLTDDGEASAPLSPRALGQEMLALHRAAVVPASQPRARARELLTALAVGDVRLPADGVLGGHPLRLVGASRVVLSGRPAVKLAFSCCDRPATVFVLPRDGQELSGAPLPVDAAGGPALLDGLHTWGLLRERAYVGVLSDHDVSTLVPDLSI